MTDQFTREDYEYFKDKIYRVDQGYETRTLAKIGYTHHPRREYEYKSDIKEVVNADKPTFYFFNHTDSPSYIRYGEHGREGIKDKIPAQEVAKYIQDVDDYEIIEATEGWIENHEESFKHMLEHLVRYD